MSGRPLTSLVLAVVKASRPSAAVNVGPNGTFARILQRPRVP
jgi:hypothetical protein